MNFMMRLLAMAAMTITLSACSEPDAGADIPPPVALTEESVGHYCNMTILEHTGPKAQIHLANNPHPIWFSQVRDAIAFLRSPEENYETVAIYVNDMGRAKQWDFPGDDTWIDAREAWFVIGSRKTGGMGTPEVIPFGQEADALAFTAEHKGLVVRLAGIPDAYVLGPADPGRDQEVSMTGADR